MTWSWANICDAQWNFAAKRWFEFKFLCAAELCSNASVGMIKLSCMTRNMFTKTAVVSINSTCGNGEANNQDISMLFLCVVCRMPSMVSDMLNHNIIQHQPICSHHAKVMPWWSLATNHSTHTQLTLHCYEFLPEIHLVNNILLSLSFYFSFFVLVNIAFYPVGFDSTNAVAHHHNHTKIPFEWQIKKIIKNIVEIAHATQEFNLYSALRWPFCREATAFPMTTTLLSRVAQVLKWNRIILRL